MSEPAGFSRSLRPIPDLDRHIAVRVLGPLQVDLGGRALQPSEWPRKSRALLSMLATAPGHRVLRDDVIDQFWPEASPEAGAGNLRRVVHGLRQALDADPWPILLEGGWIALNPFYEWTIDLDLFEELSTSDDPNHLEKAVDLTLGEVLAEHRYDDWAVPIRDRVTRTLRDLLLRLGAGYLNAGQYDAAAVRYLRALDLDPLDETAIEGVIRARVEAGQRAEAQRVFQQFEERYVRELGAGPPPEIRAPLHIAAPRPDIARDEPSEGAEESPMWVRVRPDLFAQSDEYLPVREQEAQQVRALLDGPGPSIALVTAEAGMGKTGLLADIAERWMEAGASVLAGGCYEQEGRLPYGPIHDALLDAILRQPSPVVRGSLTPLLPDLSRIVPEIRHMLPQAHGAGPMEQGDRLQVFAAVGQALEIIAGGDALLLIVDDLQWADAGTVQLLHFLLRRRFSVAFHILASYREEEMDRSSSPAGLVEEIRRPSGKRVSGAILSLPPLSSIDLGTILETRYGPIAPETVARLHRESGGNPFFAEQMVLALREANRTEIPEYRDSETLAALPPAVRDTIYRRVRRLPQEQQEVLSLGAMFGHEFDYVCLERAWGDQEDVLTAALDAATAAHVLQETDVGYRFKHPLIREVLYRGTPRPRRTRLHARAGLALEELHCDCPDEHAGELAYHFSEAGALHPDRAVRYLAMAGDRAWKGCAWTDAAGYFERAMRFADTDQVLAAVGVKWGEALRPLGRSEEALTILEAARDRYRALGDADGEVSAAVAMASVYFDRAQPDAALALLEPYVQEDSSPSIATSRLHFSIATCLWQAGRYREMLDASERAARMARSVGNRITEANAERYRAAGLYNLGRIDSAWDGMRYALDLAEKSGDLTTLTWALLVLGSAQARAGELDEAQESWTRVSSMLETLQNAQILMFHLANLTWLALRMGDRRAAEVYVERASALLEEHESHFWHAYVFLAQGDLWRYSGRFPEARAALERCLHIGTTNNDLQIIRRAQELLARIDLQDARAEAAVARLEPLLDRPGMMEPDIVRLLGTLAEAYTHVGLLELAEHTADQGIARAREQRFACDLPTLLTVRGQIRARRGDWEQALQNLDDALRQARALRCPLDEAKVLHVWGELLVDRKEYALARHRLQQALEIYGRIDAPMGTGPVAEVIGRLPILTAGS